MRSRKCARPRCSALPAMAPAAMWKRTETSPDGVALWRMAYFMPLGSMPKVTEDRAACRSWASRRQKAGERRTTAG